MAPDPAHPTEPTVPHFRAADILESITDALMAFDHDWRFTYVNDQSERVMMRARADLLGRVFWDEFPATAGSTFEREYRRAVDQQVSVTFEEFYAPLNVWVEVRAYPSADGLSVFYQDVSARKRSEEALRAALSAGGIGTWNWDLAAGRIVADAETARLFSVGPEDAAGGRPELFLRAVHPEDLPRVTRAIEEALARGEVYEVEYRVVLPDGGSHWLAARGRVERDGAGRAVALPGVVADITGRVERERRERFLAELAERARALSDPDAVIADALRSVGEFLGVSRCVFVDIDIEADTCTGRPDYRAEDSVASMAGVFPISAFGAAVVAAYGAGRAVAVDDVRADPAQVPEGSVAAYDALGIRAHASAPMVHSDRLVSCIGAHSATPRHWEPEEVELLRAVVERTWLTVEVIRQGRALAREAEATARILESITDAFFTLDRDWRFTYVNPQAERVLFRTRAELLGRDIWEAFPEAAGSTFDRQYRRALAGGVAVTFEEFYPPLGTWFEVRAYPSPAGLSVFFRDVSERRALDSERERLAERERNIARQLQAALTPSVPERVPGMALAKYYDAALDEAGVGGDFYDVFPVDKGCTVLVVGDLAGKGLAAASQVATVRNMLRYALYRARTISGALGGLNALLAEQGLLTGFATLFVGAFDSAAYTLTYANCGQEPALVRRAGGGPAELLAPTGPVLGSFEGAAFEEKTITLAPGDAFAVFTDGLTEVGRSRREMLGVEGVAALLERAAVPEGGGAQSAAEALAAGLIAGVNAAASGGVSRDDVCLLVGVVE